MNKPRGQGRLFRLQWVMCHARPFAAMGITLPLCCSWEQPENGLCSRAGNVDSLPAVDIYFLQLFSGYNPKSCSERCQHPAQPLSDIGDTGGDRQCSCQPVCLSFMQPRAFYPWAPVVEPILTQGCVYRAGQRFPRAAAGHRAAQRDAQQLRLVTAGKEWKMLMNFRLLSPFSDFQTTGVRTHDGTCHWGPGCPPTWGLEVWKWWQLFYADRIPVFLQVSTDGAALDTH